MSEPDGGGVRDGTEPDVKPRAGVRLGDLNLFAAPVVSVFAALLLAALLFGR